MKGDDKVMLMLMFGLVVWLLFNVEKHFKIIFFACFQM